MPRERQPSFSTASATRGKISDPTDRLAGLDDGHGDPPLAQEPMVDSRHRGMVEASLKPQAEKPHEHQEEGEIAVREGQQDKPHSGQNGPQDQHHPQIKPIDEIPNERALHGGLELCQGERQRGGRPTEMSAR